MKTKAFVYSRIGSPTNQVLEERMAALEGGIGAVVTSSGQAATVRYIRPRSHPSRAHLPRTQMLAIFAIAKSGDNFVAPYKVGSLLGHSRRASHG